MAEDNIDTFYETLINAEGVHGVVLFRGDSILRSSLEDKTAEQFISFAEEIFSKAQKSLSKLPSMYGEINFVTIYLQNNVTVLVARHKDVGLIVIARIEKSEPTVIDKIILKISEIISA